MWTEDGILKTQEFPRVLRHAKFQLFEFINRGFPRPRNTTKKINTTEKFIQLKTQKDQVADRAAYEC